jgi:MYND finger
LAVATAISSSASVVAAQRQPEKSQEQFQTLYRQAVELSDRREFLAAAEKLLQAIHAAPSVWTNHRFSAFATFLACLGMIKGDMTQSHVDSITKDFINNATEPAHIRARAAVAAAEWYSQPSASHFNLNTTAELYRYGLDIIAASPKKYKNRQVLHHPLTQLYLRDGKDFPSSDYTLKSILSFLDEKIRAFLSEACTVITVMPTHVHPAVKAQQEMLDDRVRDGGEVCDCCGKTLAELQMKSFQRCTRCFMVFYCSEECQREHWKKQGHKKACREEDQIEIGDDMHLYLKQPNATFTVGAFVNVISSLGGDRWQVKFYGTNELETVAGADLGRLRPPSTL